VDAMNDGELDGMQSFDKVLEGLARDGSVSVATALAYATNRSNLQLNLHDLGIEEA
jgi:Tfp pilus assembly pilus retraction ATPase PilT